MEQPHHQRGISRISSTGLTCRISPSLIVLIIMIVIATSQPGNLPDYPGVGTYADDRHPESDRCAECSIQKIFLYHGAIITVSGIYSGIPCGLLICWLQQRYGFITLPEEAYFISKAMVKLEWWHIVFVDAGTFLICFLVLALPTIIIRKIQPVRAIQFR